MILLLAILIIQIFTLIHVLQIHKDIAKPVSAGSFESVKENYNTGVGPYNPWWLNDPKAGHYYPKLYAGF